MKEYYVISPTYYSDTDFFGETWNDETQIEAQDILSDASKCKTVLEIGCGKAGILRSGRLDPRHYTGIDFSPELIETNRANYPDATFRCIEGTSRFPELSRQYDHVFSHFVLEHCVFPNLFLDECVRVLRPGGMLSILCPDFLGAGRMSSQLSGFSTGTGREKIAEERYWDALVTGYDNRIRIPLHSLFLRIKARMRPQFFINMAPSCFTNQFAPDVDAVYLTFAGEIRNYLANSVQWEPLGNPLIKYSAAHSHIYLKGRKKATR